MNLQQQVTSLELSKRLKEMGVKQESLFHWDPIWGVSEISDWQVLKRVDIPSLYAKTPDENYSAFTVAELGEILWREASPDGILKAYGAIFNVPGTHVITPEGLSQSMEDPEIGAKMLIYLLENQLITL